MSGLVPVRWANREPPLFPVGVGGVGAAAVRLLRAIEPRLLSLATGTTSGDPGLSRSPEPRLSGVWSRWGAELVVVILGERETLPWADGVEYLGGDRLAAGVLMPTLRAPLVPPEVYAAAVRARVGTDGLIACLSDGRCLLSVVGARPLGPAEVRRALAG